MAKFCEDCPLIGEATEDLVSLEPKVIRATMLYFGTGRQVLEYSRTDAVAIDYRGDVSDLLGPGADKDPSLLRRIGECQGPAIGEKRFLLWTIPNKYCPAIGRLALSPNQPAEPEK